jgi:uncharacterized protein
MDSMEPSHASYPEEIQAWRAQRLAKLTSEDGWLSVVGLFWLDEGSNAVGSGPDSRIVLPRGKAPERLGTLVLAAERLSFRVQPGVRVVVDGKAAEAAALRSDAEGEPTILSTGPIRLYVIERNGRYAVRVKDSASEARRDFHGLSYFAIDPAWRIEARFEPYDPPRSIAVPNVLGHVDAEKSPGALVFEYRGKSYRLDPVLEKGEADYFVMFGDRTNGTETYGPAASSTSHRRSMGRPSSTSTKPTIRPAPSPHTRPARCPRPRTGCRYGWKRERRSTNTSRRPTVHSSQSMEVCLPVCCRL